MIKPKISMIKSRTIELFQSLWLLELKPPALSDKLSGRRYYLLALLISSSSILSASNVLAVEGLSEESPRVQTQKGLESDLQAQSINNTNPATGTSQKITGTNQNSINEARIKNDSNHNPVIGTNPKANGIITNKDNTAKGIITETNATVTTTSAPISSEEDTLDSLYFTNNTPKHEGSGKNILLHPDAEATKPIPNKNKHLTGSENSTEKDETEKPSLTTAVKSIKERFKNKKPVVKKPAAEKVGKVENASDAELDNKHDSEQLAQELNSSLVSNNPSGTIFFADNEQIKARLSNKDINRLFVVNDKIQSINGPAGSYVAKNDPLGSAYIGVNTEQGFTLFVSTVNGHQFSLLVTPVASSGKTVVLTPTTPSQAPAKHEEAEGYQKTITSLINSMINSEPLQDYAYVPVKESKSYDFYGAAKIKPIGYYLGPNLIGSISIIKNTTKKPLSIKPSGFYTKGVRAVALSQQTLPAKTSGLLYQVVDRQMGH